MNRGEIWWARMPPPVGRRPVVLVSRESAYAVRTSITVAELSRTVRGIPSEVTLGPADGLPRRCALNTDNLVTISKARLEARLQRAACSQAPPVTRATGSQAGQVGSARHQRPVHSGTRAPRTGTASPKKKLHRARASSSLAKR